MSPEHDWIQKYYYSVKLITDNMTETLSKIKTVWNNIFPESPFDYFFLDEYFNNQYEAEQKFGKVFGIFTLLAIFIGCLGLFGLILFTTEQRTKEIGIRKVLGASVSNITFLLSNEFTKCIIISNIISIPLAWYAMGKLLHEFAFRINLNSYFWFFGTAGIVTLFIAWGTISFQTIKAAQKNPVESLKYE